MMGEAKSTSQKGSLAKRFHAALTTCQTISQTRTEAQTVMGQWWAGSHLDQDYGDVYILGPLFTLRPHFRTLKTDRFRYGELTVSLLPSSQCSHAE